MGEEFAEYVRFYWLQYGISLYFLCSSVTADLNDPTLGSAVLADLF